MRCVPALLLALWAAPTYAQQARDPAAAEALFSAAREDMDAERYREACRKFEESQRLDPAVGTVINLAACLEKLGHLSAAWEKWQQAQRQLSPGDERHAIVVQRAEAMKARVPHLVLRLAPKSPLGTKVLRDGVELGAAALQVPLPVDPGLHVLIVRAPERPDRRYEVDLREGQTRELELAPAPAASTPSVAKAPPKLRAPAPPPAPPKDAPSEEAGPPRWVGYTLLGIGGAMAIVGSVAGLQALAKKNEVDDDCSVQNGQRVCGRSGLDAADAGKTYATISNVSFAVAIIGVGAGTYLTFVAPASTQGAGVSVGGRF
ncbi:MAG: hypothetical protein R3B13_39880 [Polyangiaceae bacterium]